LSSAAINYNNFIYNFVDSTVGIYSNTYVQNYTQGHTISKIRIPANNTEGTISIFLLNALQGNASIIEQIENITIPYTTTPLEIILPRTITVPTGCSLFISPITPSVPDKSVPSCVLFDYGMSIDIDGAGYFLKYENNKIVQTQQTYLYGYDLCETITV